MSEDWAVEVRKATQREIDVAESDGNTVDGAAAILINDELVGVANEYGTVKLVAGTEATPTQEDVEEFIEQAVEFWSKAMPMRPRQHDATKAELRGRP
jgi:hypothetical protein